MLAWDLVNKGVNVIEYTRTWSLAADLIVYRSTFYFIFMFSQVSM
jgi:hypothetical protein